MDLSIYGIANDIRQDYFTPTASQYGETLLPDQNDFTRQCENVRGSISSEFDHGLFFADALSSSALSQNSMTPSITTGENDDNAGDFDEHAINDGFNESENEPKFDNDGMADSMQSLID